MKAIVIHEYGPPEVLRYEEVPDPVPRAGEIRIRVHAATVNRVLDVSLRAGKEGARGPVLPLIPGVDCAGAVDSVGEGVARWRKGMRVAKGETVAPERREDNDWRPAEAVAGDIEAARQRLTSALDANATQRAPAAAAKAQVSFDCWLEEADDPIFSPENAWKREKIVSCRDDFNAAMAEVDRAMRPAPAPAPAQVGVEVQRSYLVFFDWNKADVTAEARRIIQQAAAGARQIAVTRIEVAGHADRSGSERYNQALSERRANAVRQGLIAEGVPAGQIVTMAFGESRPLVPTADGVREPQNRRVEIVLR